MEDFTKKWNEIESLSFDIMGQAPRFMPMLGAFVLKGAEVAQFPKLVAMFMHDAGVTLAQPDIEILPVVTKAILQMQENRETNAKVFSIPAPLLEQKYKGCGNGIAIIEKATRKVLDIDYTDSKLRPLKEQNISMTKSAGRTIREDDVTITYRANFSSCQVCLF
jgi:hypothetical protein